MATVVGRRDPARAAGGDPAGGAARLDRAVVLHQRLELPDRARRRAHARRRRTRTATTTATRRWPASTTSTARCPTPASACRSSTPSPTSPAWRCSARRGACCPTPVRRLPLPARALHASALIAGGAALPRAAALAADRRRRPGREPDQRAHGVVQHGRRAVPAAARRRLRPGAAPPLRLGRRRARRGDPGQAVRHRRHAVPGPLRLAAGHARAAPAGGDRLRRACSSAGFLPFLLWGPGDLWRDTVTYGTTGYKHRRLGPLVDAAGGRHHRRPVRRLPVRAAGRSLVWAPATAYLVWAQRRLATAVGAGRRLRPARSCCSSTWPASSRRTTSSTALAGLVVAVLAVGASESEASTASSTQDSGSSNTA